MSGHDEAEFRDYVQARLTRFRREAYALCGDWHEAEDLVQHSMEKLYVKWHRLYRSGSGSGDLDAYVRTVFYNRFLDNRKSAWWRRTDHSGVTPDRPDRDHDDHGDQQPLLRALLHLPKDQRAVLVLRYWLDLSVESTAEILGFSVSKVKTAASRGCAEMRMLLSSTEEGVVERWKTETN